MRYQPAAGQCALTSHYFPDGVVKGADCLFIVPQGWYVASVVFAARSSQNVLTMGGQSYSGNVGPKVGLKVTGLVHWHAAAQEDTYACGETKPFKCGFSILLSPRNGTE